MKIYLGCKRQKNECTYCYTIYTDDRKVHHDIKKVEAYGNFLDYIKAYEWGLNRLKVMAQNKVVDENEELTILIESKNVYTWFEKGVATQPYLNAFCDLQWALSLIVNPTVILHSKTVNKNVIMKKQKEEVFKITDLLG